MLRPPKQQQQQHHPSVGGVDVECANGLNDDEDTKKKQAPGSTTIGRRKALSVNSKYQQQQQQESRSSSPVLLVQRVLLGMGVLILVLMIISSGAIVLLFPSSGNKSPPPKLPIQRPHQQQHARSAGGPIQTNNNNKPSSNTIQKEPKVKPQQQQLAEDSIAVLVALTPEQRNQPEQMIDMRVLNYELPFDNVDGGVWKQGWDIDIQKKKKNKSSSSSNDSLLQVFVVPHSHCDPGWIKTFDEYFQQQTSGIISTVIDALARDSRRTFIWAEISYFSWWWDTQSEATRQIVRTLLRNQQLEFVTGGWVQPDEANSELYAMEVQLQEGHDWIATHVGAEYIPRTGWAIDPFGYSPTAAYLWKRYNFTAMLIQRVHYAVKKKLAQTQHLEFFWRQTWEGDNNATTTTAAARLLRDPVQGQRVQPHDIFTHVMPFFSYDVPHTCGPDPSVCCQFDFARLRGSMCPWGLQPQPITESNVKERAELLLDQYRKKAALYRSNCVLIPLGDDFRYQTSQEAEAQYANYQAIFDYINKNIPDVQIKFGTLSEYFKSARESFDGPVPFLKGSFFTYSDVNEDYWSGYFTSRVFDKALDRQLERVLFAAEAMGGSRLELQAPRRALSLFQHHDGITGTAKNHVVKDYAKRIYDAIAFAQKWIIQKIPADIVTSYGPEIQPCWVSSGLREMSHNLCDNAVVVYNPIAEDQLCGSQSVKGHDFAVVIQPCETPGPHPSSQTKFVFDPKTGLMTSPIQEDWRVWKVRQGGAYLFVPDHQDSYDLLTHDHKITDGGFVVSTSAWKRTVVEKDVSHRFGGKATVIDFVYESEIDEGNQEWFVRFTGPIRNNGTFHTDLNGFNFDTHRFRRDLPVQSQVFPMPTLASIQDDQLRMTVLSEHAQGTASMLDGTIDVWLDRRLDQDDGRGLGQGVQDNRRTRTRLRVILEQRDETTTTTTTGAEFSLSPLCRRLWEEHQHPLEMFGRHVVNKRTTTTS